MKNKVFIYGIIAIFVFGVLFNACGDKDPPTKTETQISAENVSYIGNQGGNKFILNIERQDTKSNTAYTPVTGDKYSLRKNNEVISSGTITVTATPTGGSYAFANVEASGANFNANLNKLTGLLTIDGNSITAKGGGTETIYPLLWGPVGNWAGSGFSAALTIGGSNTNGLFTLGITGGTHTNGEIDASGNAFFLKDKQQVEIEI